MATLTAAARRKSLTSVALVRTFLAIAALAPAVVCVGVYDVPDAHQAALHRWQLVLLLAYIIAHAVTALVPRFGGTGRWRTLRTDEPFELGAAAAGVALAAWWPAAATAALFLAVTRLLRSFLKVAQHPSVPGGLLFVGSFIALIVVGAGALLLPTAAPRGDPVAPMEAVFTITSAVSQTGLVVRDTGTRFTRFGQVVILIWIQVGALGVLVFGALLAKLVGSGFGLRATQAMAETAEQGWTGQLSLRKLVIFTVVITHAAELVGAVVLYFGWPDGWPGAPPMETAGDRVFHSVFFSISAFCNAGFCTTSNSLQGLGMHWTTHLVIVGGIVLGSVGFPVLDDVRATVVAKARGRRTRADGSLVRLNLNSKMVLTAAACVYLIGFVILFAGQLPQGGSTLRSTVLDAHFFSINRTSGFDTLPPSETGLLSRLGLILLMFIGGAPGSVAGGVKLMVFAVMALTVWSTILGRTETTVFGRAIPDALVRKSAALIVLSLLVVMAVTGVLAATAPAGPGGHGLDALLFEATSAFGTTGLSMGVTQDQGTAGRLALCVAMFIGRVGPLATMAGLLSIAAKTRPRVAYPTEDVVIY